jgi:hypothetical protein
MKAGNATRVVLAALFAVAVTSLASRAASNFEGSWKVQDTGGKPFDITLSADGTAKGSLRPDMVGTWKEQGAAAVITWNTGWTTKIAKEDGQYKHLAYRQGQPLDGPPTNSSDAQKTR